MPGRYPLFPERAGYSACAADAGSGFQFVADGPEPDAGHSERERPQR